MPRTTQPKPTQTMREFFDRPDVKYLQGVQKMNKVGSEYHREAYKKMVELAKAVGADQFFGEYIGD